MTTLHRQQQHENTWKMKKKKTTFQIKFSKFIKMFGRWECGMYRMNVRLVDAVGEDTVFAFDMQTKRKCFHLATSVGMLYHWNWQTVQNGATITHTPTPKYPPERAMKFFNLMMLICFHFVMIEEVSACKYSIRVLDGVIHRIDDDRRKQHRRLQTFFTRIAHSSASHRSHETKVGN